MEELAFRFLELAGFKGKTAKVRTEVKSPCWDPKHETPWENLHNEEGENEVNVIKDSPGSLIQSKEKIHDRAC